MSYQSPAEVWLRDCHPKLFAHWKEAFYRLSRVPPPDLLCVVCHLREGDGLHYGIQICEADKQFLKRTFHLRQDYPNCVSGGDCPPRKRGWCQSCRLLACLSVPLDLSLIRVPVIIKNREGSKSTRVRDKSDEKTGNFTVPHGDEDKGLVSDQTEGKVVVGEQHISWQVIGQAQLDSLQSGSDQPELCQESNNWPDPWGLNVGLSELWQGNDSLSDPGQKKYAQLETLQGNHARLDPWQGSGHSEPWIGYEGSMSWKESLERSAGLKDVLQECGLESLTHGKVKAGSQSLPSKVINDRQELKQFGDESSKELYGNLSTDSISNSEVAVADMDLYRLIDVTFQGSERSGLVALRNDNMVECNLNLKPKEGCENITGTDAYRDHKILKESVLHGNDSQDIWREHNQEGRTHLRGTLCSGDEYVVSMDDRSMFSMENSLLSSDGSVIPLYSSKSRSSSGLTFSPRSKNPFPGSPSFQCEPLYPDLLSRSTTLSTTFTLPWLPNLDQFSVHRSQESVLDRSYSSSSSASLSPPEYTSSYTLVETNIGLDKLSINSTLLEDALAILTNTSSSLANLSNLTDILSISAPSSFTSSRLTDLLPQLEETPCK